MRQVTEHNCYHHPSVVASAAYTKVNIQPPTQHKPVHITPSVHLSIDIHELGRIEYKMDPIRILASRHLGNHKLDISNCRVLLHLVFRNGIIRSVGIPLPDVEDVRVCTPRCAPVDQADLCLVLTVPLVKGQISLSADGRV